MYRAVQLTAAHYLDHYTGDTLKVYDGNKWINHFIFATDEQIK